MGRIAELYEKKALGTLTKQEADELKKLLAEASAVRKDNEGDTHSDADTDSDTDTDTEEDEDKAIDKMAQKLADAAQARMETTLKSMTAELKKGRISSVVDTSGGYIVDKHLGKASNGYKMSVAELDQMKEVIPGREKKMVKEISMRTKLFLAALMTSDKQKLQLLQEGTNSGADGGYLVPAEFANMIIEDIRDINIMRQYAAPPIPTQSDTLHLPGLTSRPYAQWRSEAAVKSTTTASFTDNVFTPFSLAAIVGLSNELVADASQGVGASIVNYIANLMTVALNEKEEKAFWTGSGSGQPAGVHGNTGRTFDAGAGASDATRADTIIRAYANTPQGYRNKGVFVANMGTIFEIRRLKDQYGRYLLTDGGGLANAGQLLLQGRPLYESNYLAGGEVIFGDLDYYQIVDREGINVRVSDEATVAGSSAFEKNLTYVRVEKRLDAKVTLKAAFTTLLNIGTP